ncbi:TonB C-terminal domain-containing protein [bacterium]|nr:TonB C-terminal domain-containing protein [bacterium]
MRNVREKTPLQLYHQSVVKKMKKIWKPQPGKRVVILRCSILPDGSVLDLQLDSSSGDPEYDQLAMRAFAGAAPFPSHELMDKVPLLYGM